jgi:single-stranded-DNA-specific exonuclease
MDLIMKKWKILNKIKNQKSNFREEGIVKALLENRGIKTKKEIDKFLDPKLETVTIESVGIDKKQVKKTISRIKSAIKNKEQIVIFGDYDVDGICGTAILWETLNSMGAKVMPYIPHRIEEGYGLSIKGIENLKLKIKNCGLIITVDNGIVASKAVNFANEQKIDVIITDHHVPPAGGSKKIPNALAIVHTTKLCGTGVAYLLAQELVRGPAASLPPASAPSEASVRAVGSPSSGVTPLAYDHLALVALATVADLVPLKGANRTLLKFGLEGLRKTKRIGLLELFKESGLEKEKIGVYEIGHIIAPRLNAMGRLEYAMDSLRLICTNNQQRAAQLAILLGSTNKERQDLTSQMVLHAIEKVSTSSRSAGLRGASKTQKKLLFIADESYEQGVIGLVAGKLVEEFYRPAIVVSKGEKFSKASARSIKGFDMIEFIRSASEFLIDAGGHPMAAGFTVETTKLLKLQKVLEDKAELLLNKDLLTRSLKVDCEIPLSLIGLDLFSSLQKLSPFGMGNPEPTFVSKNVIIEDMRMVGMENKHIKFYLGDEKSGAKFGAIAFNMGDRINELHVGDKINIVYTIAKDDWNGNERLQLKIKDMENP